MTTKAEARLMWERDRTVLLMEAPFMALLAMNLDIVPVFDVRCRTAQVDGQRIFINPDFLGALTPPERVFLLGHEVWHCGLSHFLRWQGREHQKTWNRAIDHEVNSLLLEDGFTMPSGEHQGIYYPEHRGDSAETVYEALVSGAQQPTAGQCVLDEHALDGAVEAGAEGPFDDDYVPHVSLDVLRGWPERVMAVAQQVERQRGTLPSGLARVVGQLRRPQVPWQEVLRQHVTSRIGDQRSWFPPQRRHVYKGLYLPSRHGTVLEVDVALDTSGSTVQYMAMFVTELWGLMQSFGSFSLRLIECDAEVHRVRQFDQDSSPPIDTFAVMGGGGTSFIPVFDWLATQEEPCKLLLFLTDGEGSAHEQPPGYPVLWVVPDGKSAPAKWGQTLTLPLLQQEAA